MNASKRVVFVVVGLLLLAGLVAWAFVALDPLRQFYTVTDEGIQFKGGTLDGRTLDYILNGPTRGNATEGWVLVRDSYPTLRLVKNDFELPSQPAPRFESPLRGLFAAPDILGALRRTVSWLLFGWWAGDASAVCGSGGGACFWIGGTGSFSQTAHWSASTGGGTCSCTPASTDTVTFDASSGAGTATQDNATFTSGAVTMTSSSVTVAGSSNTWQVGGNWSDNTSVNNFSIGTSTVQFTTTTSITTTSSSGGATFYNLMIDIGTTATLQQTVGIGSVLSVNGTLTFQTAAHVIYLRSAQGEANPLVVGGSGSLAGKVGAIDYLAFLTVSASATVVHIPSATYPRMTFTFTPAVAVAGDGVEYRLDGNVTMDSWNLSVRSGDPFFINSQTYDVTLNGTTAASILDSVVSGNPNNGFKATSGTWTLASTVFIDEAGSANFYWQMGSITVRVSNTTGTCGSGYAWNTSGVTSGANYNVGTSTVIIQGNCGPVRWSAGTWTEFRNITFASTQATQTYKPLSSTNGLRASGTMTIDNSGGQATGYDTDVTNNTSITVGGMVVGSGGTLQGRASAIIDTGNWASNLGSFQFGTTSLTLGSGNLNMGGAAGGSTAYDVTIAGAVTLTGHVGITHVLTVNGSLAFGGQQLDLISSLASPIAFGGGASMSGTGIVGLYTSAALVTLPARSDWPVVGVAFSGGNLLLQENSTFAGIRVLGTGAGNIYFGLSGGGVVITVGTIDYTANAAIDFSLGSSITTVTGDVSISTSAYFDFGTAVLSVAGNWTNGSTSASWSALAPATVAFNGNATQTITNGGKAFPDVNVSGSGEKLFTTSFTSNQFVETDPNVPRVTITAGITWTLLSGANISGYPGQKMLLRSSVTSPWLLVAQGSTTASYLDVQWSDASGGSTVSACVFVTDSGDNVNWNFCTNQGGGGSAGPGFDCAIQYVVMRYQLTCAPVQSYSGTKWYVNGQLVSTDAALSYTVSNITIEETTVLVTLTVSNGLAASLSTSHSYRLDFRVNAFMWAVFALPLVIIVAAVFTSSRRPRRTTIVIQRPRNGGPPRGGPPSGGMR